MRHRWVKTPHYGQTDRQTDRQTDTYLSIPVSNLTSICSITSFFLCRHSVSLGEELTRKTCLFKIQAVASRQVQFQIILIASTWAAVFKSDMHLWADMFFQSDLQLKQGWIEKSSVASMVNIDNQLCRRFKILLTSLKDRCLKYPKLAALVM